MKCQYIEKVKSLMGPGFVPVERPVRDDWERLESEIGFMIPAWHSEFVDAIGSGTFGDGISFLNPAVKSLHLGLSRKSLLDFASYAAPIFERLERKPFPCKQGLVVIALTEWRIHLFVEMLECVHEKPAVIYVDSESDYELELPMTTAEFIWRAYQGTLTDFSVTMNMKDAIWGTPEARFYSPTAWNKQT